MVISLWCRCFLSISGFDSGSGAHFHSESVQRFIYCNKLVISLWCRCFLSISGFDSGSGAHFHSESVQRFIYCNKIEHLHSCKECVRVYSVLWHNSLNWSYLHDADDFFHFRVLIRVQELIFIRNQSRDSFILIKLNTLHSWKEYVRVNSN